MERFYDRPFQDFVAHETHRLIPRLDDHGAASLAILPRRLLDLSLPEGGRSCCVRPVFGEKNP
jgi:hypothetical protein